MVSVNQATRSFSETSEELRAVTQTVAMGELASEGLFAHHPETATSIDLFCRSPVEKPHEEQEAG